MEYPALQLDILAGTHDPPQEAANGSPIRTFELGFSSQCFQWYFIIAKDFLCAYGLLVGIKTCRLINAATFCSLNWVMLGIVELSMMLSQADVFCCPLAEFPAPTFLFCNRHGVAVGITGTGTVCHTFRCIFGADRWTLCEDLWPNHFTSYGRVICLSFSSTWMTT